MSFDVEMAIHADVLVRMVPELGWLSRLHRDLTATTR